MPEPLALICPEPNSFTSQRRKAQNRAAQRAFRIRQQQALSGANAKMRAMQEELKDAISMKEHFERLYENLTAEHERLLCKFEETLASTLAQTLKS